MCSFKLKMHLNLFGLVFVLDPAGGAYDASRLRCEDEHSFPFTSYSRRRWFLASYNNL